MNLALLAGVFAIGGAAIAAMATMWAKLRDDRRVGRATETEILLDLQGALGGAQRKAKDIFGADAVDAIVNAPAEELQRLEREAAGQEPPRAVAVSEPEHSSWSPLPPLTAWDNDRLRIATRLEDAAVESVQRASWWIGAYNAASEAFRNRVISEPPAREARATLAALARAKDAVERHRSAQRLLDRLPVLGAAVFVVGLTAALLTLTGVIGPSRPSAEDVATALDRVLAGDQMVDCQARSRDGFDCFVVDATCQVAVEPPASVACPAGESRTVEEYRALVGDANTIDSLSASAPIPVATPDPTGTPTRTSQPKTTVTPTVTPTTSARATATAAGQCPENQLVTFLDADDLAEIERTPPTKRGALRVALTAFITCLKDLTGMDRAGLESATPRAGVLQPQLAASSPT